MCFSDDLKNKDFCLIVTYGTRGRWRKDDTAIVSNIGCSTCNFEAYDINTFDVDCPCHHRPIDLSSLDAHSPNNQPIIIQHH